MSMAEIKQPDKIVSSAKSGSEHWVRQRASAVFLLYLHVWLVYFIITSIGLPYGTLLHRLALSCHSLHALLYVGTALYHAKLGLQVVIEDYCHCPLAKKLKLLALNFVVYAAGAYALLSLVRIIVKGGW